MRSRWLVLALVLLCSGLLTDTGVTADLKIMGMYGTSNQDELDDLTKDLFDKEFFDHIAGGEIQLRFWPGAHFGVAAAAGALFWTPTEFRIVEIPGIEGLSTAGKLTSLPVGGSALLKVGNSPIRFVAEGGLRYVYNKSSIDWTYSALGADVSLPVEFEIGDMVSAVVAGDLEVGLDQAIHVNVGLGYMFPIKKAEVAVSASGILGDFIPGEVALGDIKLEAFFIRGGVVFGF
ncbi:MAG: hypothetical protein JXO72_09825 [Vicinamibacteria bacterium]|nr:hypothetical protein [Vicinamibacteria bacterium]